MDKPNISILKKQIDVKPLTHAFENLFLYDLENMINEIYVTQLNKEFSIYGLITFSGENKNNKKLDLVRPDYNIKFQLKRDVYKNSIGFELAKVLEKKSYTVINNKILNFGLLRSNKNRFVGQKYKMKEIIDIVRVLGLQVESENYLNPINISMNSNKLLKKLEKYKKNKYRFVLKNFLFSSNFTNEIDVIFLCCEGLSNAKEALVDSELKKVLGVTYVSKVPDWSLAKGQIKRSQAIFAVSEFQTKPSHLAFAFTTRNLSNLLSFTATLLDSDGKEIKFPQDENKIPTIGYRIEIIK